MGSWGKIGGEGGCGECSGIGSESSSSNDRSRLEACGWLGIHEVGSKDLRCIDKGVCFVTRMGVSAGRSGESNNGGDGETGLGVL